MKKFSLFLIAMVIGQFIYAQNSDSPEVQYKNDLGFDVSRFVTIFNSNFESNSPYVFTYRRNYEKGALRFGLGGRTSTSSNSIEPTNDIDQANHSLNFRVGYEWQTNFEKRWQLYYGLDGSYSLDHTMVKQQNLGETTKVVTHVDEYGLSPVVGLKFKLNKRLSLATETSVMLSHVYQSQSNTNETTGVSYGVFKNRIWRGNFIAPSSVFLLCYF